MGITMVSTSMMTAGTHQSVAATVIGDTTVMMDHDQDRDPMPAVGPPEIDSPVHLLSPSSAFTGDGPGDALRMEIVGVRPQAQAQVEPAAVTSELGFESVAPAAAEVGQPSSSAPLTITTPAEEPHSEPESIAHPQILIANGNANVLSTERLRLPEEPASPDLLTASSAYASERKESSTLPPPSPAPIDVPPAFSSTSTSSSSSAQPPSLPPVTPFGVDLSGFAAALGGNTAIPSPTEELLLPPLSMLGLVDFPLPPSSPSATQQVFLPAEEPSDIQDDEDDGEAGSYSYQPTLRRGRSERRYKPAEQTIVEEPSMSRGDGPTPTKPHVSRGGDRDGSSTPTLREPLPPTAPPSAPEITLDVSPPTNDDASSSSDAPSSSSPSTAEESSNPPSPPWARSPPRLPLHIIAAAVPQTSSRPSFEKSRMGFGRQSRQTSAAPSPESTSPRSSTPTSNTRPILLAAATIPSPASSGGTPGPTPPPKDASFKDHDPYAVPFVAVGGAMPALTLSFPKVRRKRSDLMKHPQSTTTTAPPTSFNLPAALANGDGGVVQRTTGRRRSLSDAGPSRRPGTGNSATSSVEATDAEEEHEHEHEQHPSSAHPQRTGRGFFSIKRRNQHRHDQQNEIIDQTEIVIREANRLQNYEDPTDIVIRQANATERLRAARRSSQEIYISAARSDHPRSRSDASRDESYGVSSSEHLSADEHGALGSGALSPSETVGKKGAWHRLFASSTTHAPTVTAVDDVVLTTEKPRRTGLFSSTSSKPTVKPQMHSFLGNGI